MFRLSDDHHQGAYLILVKITWLKFESSCVVMRQHTVIRFACCIVWRGMSTAISNSRKNSDNPCQANLKS
jgi:hypothetical protein